MNAKAVPVACLALALFACERAIDGVDGLPIGGGGSGQASTSITGSAYTVGVTATTGYNPSPPSAIALMTSELPSGTNPCGFQSCTPPPGMLFLAIASPGNSCQFPEGQSPDWQMLIGIPANDQAAGTYNLSDMTISDEGTFTSHGPSGPGTATTAAGGFMGGGQGTIEVFGVNKTQISFRLSGTSSNAPSDGVYIANRCTPLP